MISSPRCCTLTSESSQVNFGSVKSLNEVSITGSAAAARAWRVIPAATKPAEAAPPDPSSRRRDKLAPPSWPRNLKLLSSFMVRPPVARDYDVARSGCTAPRRVSRGSDGPAQPRQHQARLSFATSSSMRLGLGFSAPVAIEDRLQELAGA